jgi:DNA-directed RNA polymerase specialized sigma24 family protein
MATSFATESLTPSPGRPSWCFLLLDHLDEFATLAWYLVADGSLVEDTFARTMAKLDMIVFDFSIPALAYSYARDILITEAMAVLSEARREEDETQVFQPNSNCGLPDQQRLAFILRLIIRSSEAEIAGFLGVSPSEVQGLVRQCDLS